MSVDSIQGIRDVLTPNSHLGAGVSWPPREDPETGDFLRARGPESVRVCLKNLLTTVVGEISPRFFYGTRIDELIFSQADDGFIQEILDSVAVAIRDNELRVTLIDISWEKIPITISNFALKVSIRYRLVETGEVQTFVETLTPAENFSR